MLNPYQLRKEVFDYLKTLYNTEIVLDAEHPKLNASNVGKPKGVVELVRDAAHGNYETESINNPEIQITFYSQTNLELTKPYGLLFRTKQAMQQFQNSSIFKSRCNYRLVRNLDVGYISELQSFSAYLIYVFYLGE